MKINDNQAVIWASEFLLQDERAWCKEITALTKFGDIVEAACPDAVKWCVTGALRAFDEYQYEYESWRVIPELVQLNDNAYSHWEVLDRLNRMFEDEY